MRMFLACLILAVPLASPAGAQTAFGRLVAPGAAAALHPAAAGPASAAQAGRTVTAKVNNGCGVAPPTTFCTLRRYTPSHGWPFDTLLSSGGPFATEPGPAYR